MKKEFWDTFFFTKVPQNSGESKMVAAILKWAVVHLYFYSFSSFPLSRLLYAVRFGTFLEEE